MRQHIKSQSAMRTVLKALIPYTKENLLLAFKPGKFFDELERTSNYHRKTLRDAFYRAKRTGYIKTEGSLVRLTNKGLDAMQPYIAQKLNKHSRLMITFDIPEQKSYLRRKLRIILKEWRFEQVQKSVWISNYDYGDALSEMINEMELGEYVQVFECAQIFPKTYKLIN